MFERFSAPARAVVVEAAQASERLNSPQIACEHLLLAVALDGHPALAEAGITAEALTAALTNSDEQDARALRAIGIDVDSLAQQVDTSFGRGTWRAAKPQDRRRRSSLAKLLLGDHRPFTPAAKKCLELSLREALADNSRSITPTHILRGLVRAPADAVGHLIDAETMAKLAAGLRRAA